MMYMDTISNIFSESYASMGSASAAALEVRQAYVIMYTGAANHLI